MIVLKAYHEYTSAAGGKIFFPASCSFLRKRFSSKKSLLSRSSFNCANQLSSNDWISKANKSFCSVVSFSTHFALSNLGKGVEAEETVLAAVNTGAGVVLVVVGGSSSVAVGGEEEMVEEACEAIVLTDLAGPEGEEKKEVIEALPLGFLAVDAAMSAALRFRGVVMTKMDGVTNDQW